MFSHVQLYNAFRSHCAYQRHSFGNAGAYFWLQCQFSSLNSEANGWSPARLDECTDTVDHTNQCAPFRITILPPSLPYTWLPPCLLQWAAVQVAGIHLNASLDLIAIIAIL